MGDKQKLRDIFLCTAYSARSQMAEGVLRWLGGERVEAASAGTHPSTVNPFTIRALQEIGVDISQHHSKSAQPMLGSPFDVVNTVCDNAAENCPVFSGNVERNHWGFTDPAAANSDDAKTLAVRTVRDGLL